MNIREKIKMKKLFVLLFLVFNSALVSAEEYKEGVHYKTFPQQLSYNDKIQVQEFFWYGCPHCYSFEPFLKQWKKSKSTDVDFVRVPAIFRPEWEVQARTYYALSNMGVIEDVHGKIFDELHKNKKQLNTLPLMTAFLEKNGVDKEKFMNEYKSFSVDGMVRKAKKKQNTFKIQGVPSVVINGKYISTGSMAGSYDNLIKIIDYLVKKEAK